MSPSPVEIPMLLLDQAADRIFQRGVTDEFQIFVVVYGVVRPGREDASLRVIRQAIEHIERDGI